MFGWRGRIGFICPSVPLDNIPLEFARLLPEGVAVSYTSLHIQNLQKADFERALSKLEEATRIMVEGEVDCIVCGGGPVVTFIGDDKEILDCIRAVTPVPAITSAGVTALAMEKLGIKRVAVASPYDEERNRLLTKFLETRGVKVVAVKGLGLKRAMDIYKLAPEASYRLAREVFREAPDADGIYVPCARFPVLHNISMLEADLGCPVITNIQAAVWWGLETLGIRTPVPGYGRLLGTLVPSSP